MLWFGFAFPLPLMMLTIRLSFENAKTIKQNPPNL